MRARYYVPVLCVFVYAYAAALSAEGPQVKVDEARSTIVLRTNTYDVSLTANSSDAISAVTLELKVLDPKGVTLASATSRESLHPRMNRMAAAVVLPSLPKQRAELLWYRLAYRIVGMNGEKLASGILPLFKAVDDFALHVSAPAIIQPGKKFFVRVRTTHPVLTIATPGVAVSAQLRLSIAGTAVTRASARTDARGYATTLAKALIEELRMSSLSQRHNADGSTAACNVEVRTMAPDGSGERVRNFEVSRTFRAGIRAEKPRAA